MQQQTTDKIVNFNLDYLFPCAVYSVDCSKFLDTVNQVSEEYLQQSHNQREMNEIYPLMMSDNFSNDPRMKEFCEFVGASAWNILNDQGYDMNPYAVVFDSMWTQEHHKQSSMEQHVHGYGSQLIGFYFLEVPTNSSRVVFHDPRAGKVIANLPEKNMSAATYASQMINFEPKPGMLFITNSWLPHSFTRNSSEKPLKFVHFNIGLNYNEQSQQVCPAHQRTCVAPSAEVI